MENCEQCGHPHDPHLVIPTGEEPTEGGVIICNLRGCKCYATWAIPQMGGSQETVRIPDEAELENIRLKLQTP